MFCEQCGSQIADGDKFCQECGWKVTEEVVENVAAEAEATVEAVAEETTEAVEAVTEEAKAVEETVAEETKEAVENVTTEAEVAVENVVGVAAPVTAAVAANPAPVENSFWSDANVAPVAGNATQKKSRKKWPFVVLGVVALVAILVVANFARLRNFYQKMVSTPEEYYQIIETKQVDELVNSYMSGYDKYMEMLDMESYGGSVDLTFELGEDLVDLLEMSGLEIDWFESANLAFDVNMQDELYEIGAAAGVNDVDILSGNMIIDLAEEFMYMQFPDLNEDYVGFDFEDLGVEIDEEMFATFDIYKKYIPEFKDMDKLLSKYMTLVIEQFDDVEEESAELEVGDISQKCTALEVTIDTETAQKIAEAVLTELSEDDDFKKLFENIVGIAEETGYPADAEELYDEFLEEVESALENVDSIDMGEEEIVMTVYVNGKGEVIGREIEVAGTTFRYAMPQKGSKFEMECYVEMPDFRGTPEYDTYYDEDYEPEMLKFGIEGEGKKKGDKITGDFSVKFDSTAYVNIQVEGYNVEKAKEGEMVGTFTFTLPKSLKNMLSEQGGYEMAMIASYLNYGLEIDMDTDSDGGTVSIALVDDDEFFAKLTIESESGKGEKISVPSSKEVVDAMDEDAVEEWVEEFDWDAIVKKLEKAKVDDEYIEMFEDFIDDMY